ncbi:MAG: hypothetical protein AAF387_20875 [Pseudomonadota bacterium]
MVEPETVATCVKFANVASDCVNRPIDYFHIPVPRNRDDDEYFSPLSELVNREAKYFVGLFHHTDGIEGTNARIETAKRHIHNFGNATECGF